MPYLDMSDPPLLVDEVQWCLGRGARVIAIRQGPVATAEGMRSPADPMLDRFWALAHEAGVVVTSHDGADSTYVELQRR